MHYFKLFITSLLIATSFEIALSQSFSTSTGPQLSISRMYHEAQTLPDGNVLIMGGLNFLFPDKIYHNSCEIFNPNTNTIASAENMNTVRYFFMSAVLNDGNILAIGGKNETESDLTSCEIYNTQTQKWTYVDDLKDWHSGGKAVTLQNGKVLVAGGASLKSEMFDSYTQKWSFAGDMSVLHGEGMTLTLLNNGDVLAVGGNENNSAIEIFSSNTNTWTLLSAKTIQPRREHSAKLLPDGRVFIVGTTFGDANSSKQTEIFDPVTKTTTRSADLIGNLASIKMEMLDNGNLLAFGLGSDLIPNDTKIFQEFNFTTNTWSAAKYSNIGLFACTMTRLIDGRILIAGGNSNSGEGSSKQTILLNQLGYNACTSPNLNIQMSSNPVCFGKDVNISLSSTESGVKYSVYAGQNNTGTIIGTGSNNVPYTIPAKFVTPGINIISISITKNGCINKNNKNNLVLNVPLSNSTQNYISIQSLPPLLCPSGSKVLVEVYNPDVQGTYMWNNGATGTKLEIEQPQIVSVRHKDINGCYSLTSETIEVRYMKPEDLITSDHEIICNSPTQLHVSPTGGVWTGSGVTTYGLFDPSKVSVGSYVVKYEVCGYSASKRIEVQKNSKVDFEGYVRWPQDTLCEGLRYDIPIINENTDFHQQFFGFKYHFYIDGVYTYRFEDWSTWYPSYRPEKEKQVTLTYKIINVESSFTCPTDTLVLSKTFQISSIPSMVDIVFEDTACSQSNTLVKIINPQNGVFYCANYGNVGIIDTIKANQNTTEELVLSTLVNGTFSLGVYAFPSRSCFSAPILMAEKYVSEFTPNTDIISNDLYYLGDNVAPAIQSNCDTFEWTIDGNIQASPIAPEITYTNPGKHTYQVISNSKFGCSDTTVREIKVVMKPKSVSNNVCLFDSSLIDPNTIVFESIVDKKGNSIYVGFKHITDNFGYGSKQNGIIEKYSAGGDIVWKLSNQGWGPEHSMRITGIDIDEDNNIYITGSYYAAFIDFGGFIINHPETSANYGHAFVAKISEEGKLKWFITTSEQTFGIVGGADIKYKNRQLFVSAKLSGLRKWKNHLDENIEVKNIDLASTYNILQMDTAGRNINLLARIGSGEYPDMQIASDKSFFSANGIYVRNIINLSPNLQVLPYSKIAVSGTLKDSVLFGETMIKSFNYSEFTGIIDTSTIGWESVRLETSASNISVGGEDLDRPTPIYTDELEKISVVNFTNQVENSWSSISTEYKVDLNENESFITKGQTSLIKRIDINGNLLWKRLIKNSSVNQLLMTKDETQVIAVGTFLANGLSLEFGNEDIGFKTDSTDDVFAMGFDAQTGEALWAEKLGSKENNDKCFAATLSTCNELTILGISMRYPISGFDSIWHNSKSITAINNPYLLKLPLSGVCHSQNCDVLNALNSNITTIRAGQVTAFPNPTQDILWVKSEDGQACQKMVLKDLKGRILLQETFVGEKESKLNLSSFSEGIYFVECTFANKVSVQKISLVR